MQGRYQARFTNAKGEIMVMPIASFGTLDDPEEVGESVAMQYGGKLIAVSWISY